MSDSLVFEEPPKKTRRSEHYGYLLALQEHPDKWARYRGDQPLSEKLANGVANSLRSAASQVGAGYEVTARRVPPAQRPADVVADAEVYGVWVRYAPDKQAAEMIAETMAVPPVEVPGDTVVGDGTGQALPPIPTPADVLQRGVVDSNGMPWDDLPVGGAVPGPLAEQAADAGGSDDYTGPRTTAYGEPF